MKTIVSLFVTCLLAVACTENDPSGGPGGPGGPGPSSGDCAGDNCVCPSGEACDHTCSEGAAECHIQSAFGQPIDVTCRENAECHIQCGTASSCKVECGGSAECHVTCPATGCTVTNCVGAACEVTCGSNGDATIKGTTATCP